jgi:hypothetical protein
MTSHAYSAGIARNVSLVSSYWKFPYDTVIKFYPTNFKLDSILCIWQLINQQLTKYGNSDHIYVRCLRRGQIEKITPLFLACDATEMYADSVISSKLLYISEVLARLFCLQCKYIYIVSVTFKTSMCLSHVWKKGDQNIFILICVCMFVWRHD